MSTVPVAAPRVTIVSCPDGMFEIYQGRGLWGVASTGQEAAQVRDECAEDLEEQRRLRGRATPWRGPQQRLMGEPRPLPARLMGDKR